MSIFMQTGGKFSLLIKDLICPSLTSSRELVGVPNKFGSKVYLRKISDPDIKLFKSVQNVDLHRDQIVIDIGFSDDADLKEYMEESNSLVEWIIFSVILSLDDIHVIWEDHGDTCEISQSDGLGTGLPLAIFRFNNAGVNDYYANDGEKSSRTGEYFVEYSVKNIDELQKIIIGRAKADSFTPSALVSIHTINWVKFLLPACVMLFSCYELLTDKGRQGASASCLIKQKYPRFNITVKQIDLLNRFQFLRNAIAHPSNHKIERKGGKVYSITRFSPSETNDFSILEISEVRKILIQLIRFAYTL